MTHTVRGASLQTSTLTVGPHDVEANGHMFARVTIQLKDDAGNNLTAGFDSNSRFGTSGRVFFRSTRGKVWSSIDNGDGTYSSSLHGIEPGPATVTAYCESEANQFADTETVTFHQPQVAQGMKADFNGDGRHDMLIRAGDNTVVLWLMNGVTPIGGANLGGTGSAKVAGVGDFDGNGMSDILLRTDSGDIAIWFMNSTTILRTAYVGNPGSSYFPVASADFNGDDKADILLRDVLGNIGMWIMNGEFIANGALVGSPGSYSVVGVGDLNGDGKADIILKDNAGSIGGWLMNGPAITAGGLIGSIGPARVGGVADFNRDGKEDIVIHDTQDGVGYWSMNGTNVVAGELLSQGGFGSFPLAAAGDFDGDGDADLMFRYAGNGELRYRHTGMSPQGGVFGTDPRTFVIFSPLAFDHTIIP